MNKTQTRNFQTARKSFVAGLTNKQLRSFVAHGCILYCYRDDDGNVIFNFVDGDPSDLAIRECVPGGVASVGYTPWENVTTADIRKMDPEVIRESIDDSTDTGELECDLDEQPQSEEQS